MFRVLLIEDNEGDVNLFNEVCEGCPLHQNNQCFVHFCYDGEEALEFLETNSGDIELIFLDLNLPRVSGMEVLKRIKNDDRWKMIPVVIFTTSSNPDHVIDAYKNYANMYVSKPHGVVEFFTLIHKICGMWRDMATLPNRDS